MDLEAFPMADGSFPRHRPGPVTIGLDGDALTLGGFVVGRAERFDEPRAAALLAAAYGEALSPSALAYLRGAVRKRREGHTPLALTYLALAGLPPLANSAAALERLSKADALMEAGVAPSTIVEALAPRSVALARAYNPDQPRVPAGNGEISGQWTSGDAGGATSGSRHEGESESTATGQTAHTPGILVADNSPNWAQYLNPIGTADAAERTGAPFNGPAPNTQHQTGVNHAIARYRALGYDIFSDKATAVDVVGFATPRVYDFVVRDPTSNELIGVQVKTTLGDTIFLNPGQVVKDVALIATGGATARVSGQSIMGVSYVTYCAYCDAVDFRGTVLYEALKMVKVPFKHQRLPK